MTAGIEKTLTEVPASKLINAIPFYTRIWQEDGAGNYVDSQAVDMQTAADKLASNGIQAVWVDNVGQNYGEFSIDGLVYRIWLEDAKSIEEKMKLIRTYDLAGVSAWRLGYENADIWNTMITYTN